MNSAIFKFIWENKKDKIKHKVMYLDYDQGGLRAPSIYVLSKSLKLAWISRLLSDENKSVYEFIVNLKHKLKIFLKNLSCRRNDVNSNVWHWLLSQQYYYTYHLSYLSFSFFSLPLLLLFFCTIQFKRNLLLVLSAINISMSL